VDMIPSLGMKRKVDSRYVDVIAPPVVETEKVMPVGPLDTEEEPVRKKKKVSYKDIADELLRDY